MSDLYYEQLVTKKKTLKDSLPFLGLVLLTVLAAAAGLLFHPAGFLLALLLGVGAGFAKTYTDVEFEYLFVNGDLDIDRIYSKSKRKKAKSIKFEEVELAAVATSHRLDYYNNNNQLKVEDYSSGTDTSKQLVMIVKGEGGPRKVIIEPDEALANTIKNTAPGKVFFN